MTPRSMTALRRVRIFDAAHGVCHLCGIAIKTGDKWEAEHVIALECGGTDADDNLRPAHIGCHKAKTADDHKTGAKLKRVRARHIGADKPKGLIKSAGFAKRERERMDKPPALPRRGIYEDAMT